MITLWAFTVCMLAARLYAFDVHEDTVGDEDIFKPDLDWRTPDGFSEVIANHNETESMLPSLNNLFSRQQRTCPYPVKCSGGQWCCPAGSQCCPQYLKCCETDSNCIPQGCCPKTAQTCGGTACAPPGSVCCSGHVCPQGYACNDNQASTCCTSNEIVCPGTCCPSGSTCAVNQPGYCQRPRISTTRTTRATTAASTRTSSSSQECTPGSAARSSLSNRASSGSNCIEACHVGTRQNVKVWEVERIVGKTDQLIDSMCRGIAARSKAGQLPSGLNDGEDIVTYNGRGKGNRVSNVNCAGQCQNARTGLECDEYPPARWTQKDTIQTFLCIDNSQNSKTQGPMLSKMVRDCNMQPNDKMLVRVKGGCQGARIRRDVGPEKENISSLTPRATIDISGANATFLDPYGDGSLTYVGVNLGELANGHYDLNLNLKGQILNVSVVNSDGDVIANVDAPSASQTLSFDLDEDPGVARGLSLIAYTDDTSTNITVEGTGTTTESNAPSSSTAASAGSLVSGLTHTGLIFFVICWSLLL